MLTALTLLNLPSQEMDWQLKYPLLIAEGTLTLLENINCPYEINSKQLGGLKCIIKEI
jgi:hypothetical protein